MTSANLGGEQPEPFKPPLAKRAHLPVAQFKAKFYIVHDVLSDGVRDVIATGLDEAVADAIVLACNSFASLSAQLDEAHSKLKGEELLRKAAIEAKNLIADERDVLSAQNEKVGTLIEELRNDFINIVVGGCTCGTKPPDPALHELNCHYRMAESGLARIEKHRALLSPSRGDGV